MRDSIDSSAAENKTKDGVAALNPRVTPVGKRTSRLSPCIPACPALHVGHGTCACQLSHLSGWRCSHIRSLCPFTAHLRLRCRALCQTKLHCARTSASSLEWPLRPQCTTSAQAAICMCRVRIGQGELGKVYGRSREAPHVWQAVALARFDLRHQCAKPRACPGCQVLRAHLVSRKGQV